MTTCEAHVLSGPCPRSAAYVIRWQSGARQYCPDHMDAHLVTAGNVGLRLEVEPLATQDQGNTR